MNGKSTDSEFKRAMRLALAGLLLAAFSLGCSSVAAAQQSKVLGEIQLTGATKSDRDSGVWIDGQYVGYLRELKRDKKIMLLPGDHDISVRQAGFMDFNKHVVLEPAQVQALVVSMARNPKAIYPNSSAAELKLNITPDRAAIFLDNGYVGHAADFGGKFHSMLVSPGKHRIKVELPGYKTFETEINPLPNQKTEIKTDLEAGSIQEAGALVKEQ